MNKKYKLLLLDFDGVLSDSLQICQEEINKLHDTDYPTIPLVFSQDDMTNVYSTILSDSLKKFGLSIAETKTFFDKHSHSMNLRSDEVEPFYKIIDALNICAIPKIIITSSYSEAVLKILKKCPSFLKSTIDFVYGREQKKTKTEKILNALEYYNYTKQDALYVGDLVSDILYSKKVPIDIACVGYGYHPSYYLKEFNPDYLLESIDDFNNFIKLLNTTN